MHPVVQAGFFSKDLELRSVRAGAFGHHQSIEAMTAENRMTQTTGSKAKKTSKQLSSCTSASSPLKRLVPDPTTKCMKGSLAKSPSTSSSDSGCGGRGLQGGTAVFNRKGMKDALEDAKISTSECSSDTTGTDFEASNEISLKYIELDETKCITIVAEPDPEPHCKELDVLHSNLAMNWFSLGGDDFDGFMKTKDQNPDNSGSENQISLSCGVKAVNYLDSVPDGTANGHTEVFQGADSRDCRITTSSQETKSADGKVVEEELRLQTPDVKECPKWKSNSRKCEDGPDSSETSEGISEANAPDNTQHTQASETLLRLEGCGIYAFRGSPWSTVLLSSLFILLTILFSVLHFTEDETVPPPT